MTTVDNTECLSELVTFLGVDTRSDVRTSALRWIEGLSSSSTGATIFKADNYLLCRRLLALLFHRSSSSTTTDDDVLIVLNIFVNLTADCDDCANYLMQKDDDDDKKKDDDLVRILCLLSSRRIEGGGGGDAVELSSAKLLANLSRHNASIMCARIVRHWPHFVADTIALMSVVDDESSDMLANTLLNLTSLKSIRIDLLACLPTLASILDRPPERLSSTRHRVCIELVRNLCFDDDVHMALLANESILVAIVKPLIGAELLDADENDRLPIDLQYMPDDKQRHADPIIRVKLLETLYQLCSSRYGREHLRNSGIYALLREYHRWEVVDTDAERLTAALIGVLIRTESEMCLDDDVGLRDVNIDGCI